MQVCCTGVKDENLKNLKEVYFSVKCLKFKSDWSTGAWKIIISRAIVIRQHLE